MQPNLYYLADTETHYMEFTTTGQIMSINQNDGLKIANEIPKDAEAVTFDASILGVLDYMRFSGKTDNCPINPGTLLLAICDLKIYNGE